MVKMMGNHLIIPGGTRTIDATGKYVMPGGIDMNVHLQRPGHGTQTIDDFYQGTKAALAGGTTMVVDMVSTLLSTAGSILDCSGDPRERGDAPGGARQVAPLGR